MKAPRPLANRPILVLARILAILLLFVLGVESSAAASPIVLSLTNSGMQVFLVGPPNLEVAGASSQPVTSSVGVGSFDYDFFIHVLQPNLGGSLMTGVINFTFGSLGGFAGSLTGSAFSTAPVIDPVTLFRTVTETAPFVLTSGSGFFAGATGSGTLVVTTQRQFDFSPTGTFVSQGAASVDPVPEPASLVLLASGLVVIAALKR